ncbi:MAG: rhodanese-like domain-containing protein [Candidatus Eremiobacteraeota bacterium]|nr:rhodanese-like domain-containing protein [Candidatus Eremiobacteraeota bacterium]
MSTNIQQLIAAADAVVPRISADELRAMQQRERVTIVDVREDDEVRESGKIPGAIAIPIGLIEARADRRMPSYDSRLNPEAPVVLYCASGNRAALAGKALVDLRYSRVYNLGGFRDESGALLS